ncbi:MAG: tRNA (adenosine(37)-N6)-threonylcarbamoyltransferase complex ATPase subunit type 1 TsaE [Ferruginibacter sp.]
MELMFSLDAIEDAANKFLSAVNSSKVIALHGEMGAGKTTFIHACCRQLGVQDTLSSPTFSIINEYLLKDGNIAYHMDLYRLKNEQEAMDAGVEDCLISGNLCLVEWAEKAPGLFREETLDCYLYTMPDNNRKLQINL